MTALGNAYDHCADAKEASVGGRACEDMAMSRPDSTGLLSTIAVPTMIVVGDGDRITPPAR